MFLTRRKKKKKEDDRDDGGAVLRDDGDGLVLVSKKIRLIIIIINESVSAVEREWDEQKQTKRVERTAIARDDYEHGGWR